MRLGIFFVAIAGLAGCDAYDKDLGPTPFYCGPTEPRCPTGYSCAPGASGMDVCVSGSVTDEFDCADDSAFEPNETVATAIQSGADVMRMVQIEGRAICPAGDKDFYTVGISASAVNLEITVTYDADGGALKAAILNAGGVPIAPATAVPGVDNTIRANAPNLQIGPHYVQVSGPTEGTQVNNYRMTIIVSGP